MPERTHNAQAPLRASFRVDVSGAVDLAGAFEIAGDLVSPVPHTSPPPAGILVCLPGGFLSRRYFDLDVAGLPPIATQKTLGVGHSMGSALTVEQQAAWKPYLGLILFSFTTRGTPAFLNEEQRAYAHQPERARRELGELARRTMGSPYPPSATDSESGRRAAFGVGTAPPETEEALHQASTRLLALGGLLAMIPGGYAPAAEKIDVPTFIVVGDHDLHNTDGLREELPLCPDFSAMTLEDCWHCHFVSNQRAVLWDRVGDWISDRIQL